MSDSPSTTPPRRVVCAALRVHGVIICGARHYDEIMRRQVRRLLVTEQDEGTWTDRTWAGADQGFIDQRGLFLTRTEAWQVAKAAGQIIRRVGGDTAEGGALYSENLY